MSSWPNAVTIGSFVSDLDAPGDYRLTTMVEGWGSPARRLTITPRTGAHGAYLLGQQWAERTIVHSGLIECSTATVANTIAQELAALAPGVDYAYVVDHEAIGSLACTVQVALGPEPEWVDDRSFTYILTLVAPDPFKRALSPETVSIATGTSVPFTALGTAAAEIEVTTTSSGTVHVEQGGLAIMASSVPSGTVFTSGPGFDNLPRSVVGPGGEDLYSLTLPGTQWPAVVPGANSILNQGTAAVQVRYFPTYA